ncbi:MAG TPA: inositol monophosphatase family protein [Solirubrobacteraceae bacterium]|nr:inositol monophosphatase family protein [Solirubrobacteraceae bacterium]
MPPLVVDLALSLREVVLPELGSPAGRAQEGTAPGGDATFAIDARAEEHLEAWVAEHAPGVAFYSEDRGLVGDGDRVLIVDPIDGTRPAMAGFESACVSVALAHGDRMGDVVEAAIVEIKSGHRFVARRGEGLRASVPLRLSRNEDVERMFWVYGLRGRPSRAVVEVLGDLLDASSTLGGTFDLGSATYDATRVLTGQLDAYVEPSPRIVEEVPGMAAEFRRVGRGGILNNTPYDLAAAYLCLVEGGAVISDARGEPLDDRPLLGSGPEHQMSCIAAANPTLHRRLVEAVDQGIRRLTETLA